MLKQKNIPHNVLNAKQHAKEAQMVAEAGLAGAVTITTKVWRAVVPISTLAPV